MPITPDPPDQAPVVSFDLNLTAAQRIAQFDAATIAAGRDMYLQAQGGWLRVPLAPIFAAFGRLYRRTHGPHIDELEAWARAFDGTHFGEICAINCGYELDHLGTQTGLNALLGTLGLGCTSAVVDRGDEGPLHLRNLDWPIHGLGSATRIFEVTAAAGHRFVGVSFPGYIGMLTGMVPGAYSLSVNWAPPHGVPTMEHGPSFFARSVLTRCRTYEEAREELEKTVLSTSTFYTLCGTKPQEGCVIERTARKHETRRLQNQPPESPMLVQTNHHQVAGFGGKMDASSTDLLVRTSKDRQTKAENEIRAVLGSGKIEDFRAALRAHPVTNWQTCQRIVLHPASGRIWLERRVEKAVEKEGAQEGVWREYSAVYAAT